MLTRRLNQKIIIVAFVLISPSLLSPLSYDFPYWLTASTKVVGNGAAAVTAAATFLIIKIFFLLLVIHNLCEPSRITIIKMLHIFGNVAN